MKIKIDTSNILNELKELKKKNFTIYEYSVDYAIGKNMGYGYCIQDLQKIFNKIKRNGGIQK